MNSRLKLDNKYNPINNDIKDIFEVNQEMIRLSNRNNGSTASLLNND